MSQNFLRLATILLMAEAGTNRPAASDFASCFDAPQNSPAHKRLADTAWMGGPLVAVPFYLGSLIVKNLFRETAQTVEFHLVRYMTALTSTEGAELFRDANSWLLAADILRFHFERGSATLSTPWTTPQRARQIEAIERYLINPSISMADLAAELGTTEKQLRRNSSLNHARSLAERRRSAPSE